MMTLGSLTNKYRFLVVHGAGSFGHFPAKAYQLKDGRLRERQKVGVVRTHHSMLQLTQLLQQSAFEVGGLYPVGFPPIALCTTGTEGGEDGRVKTFAVEPLRAAVNHGFTPFVFGDVVFDHDSKVTILSGDQITPLVAQELGASQIIMLTDVDGVYDDNPTKNPDAQLLSELNLADEALLKELSERASSGKTRVTGEMEKKLLELQTVVSSGVEAWVMSGLDPSNLAGRLGKGLHVGTRLTYQKLSS